MSPDVLSGPFDAFGDVDVYRKKNCEGLERHDKMNILQSG